MFLSAFPVSIPIQFSESENLSLCSVKLIIK